MKRQGLSVLVLTLALLPTIAFAQLDSTFLKADVPFAFTVGDRTIPAGACLVRAAGVTRDALWIGNVTDKIGTYVLPLHTSSLKPSGRTVMVFHKYGDRYFLAQVWFEGRSVGQGTSLGKDEKELIGTPVKGAPVLAALRLK